MKELFILIAHLLTTLVRLAQPGGVLSGRAIPGPPTSVVGAAAKAKARTLADPVGSSVLRSVLALAVAQSNNEGFDCAATVDRRAVPPSLGPPQIPTALCLQAPDKAGVEGPLGGAYCCRACDETGKSQIRLSEDRSTDFVCFRR